MLAYLILFCLVSISCGLRNLPIEQSAPSAATANTGR